MLDFRIFTNDRIPDGGVPMYSCLKSVKARNATEALQKCPRQFDAPHCAPAKAIRWPESEQSPAEKAWLALHVGDGFSAAEKKELARERRR
jgi:hypothetical protein